MLECQVLICDRISVVTQPYRSAVVEEYILEGNSAVLKCTVPSFVADFITVHAWVEETTGDTFYATNEYGRQCAAQPFATSISVLLHTNNLLLLLVINR